MKKMSKRIIALTLAITIAICLFGGFALMFSSCNAASRVNHNLNEAADNFECLRKITVYNARTDLIILEMEGYMSLSNNATNELVVTCKVGPDKYKKNFVFLNEYVIYVVEDINSTSTDPYHYKVKFYTATPDFDINE